MNVLSPDSVRIHNEMMHTNFSHYLLYGIPALVVFVLLWAKFVKD